MPVYSMTGYASVQHSASGQPETAPSTPQTQRRLGLELRTVNSRFLDLSLRLPDELRQHEPGLREALTRRLKRGKVELRLLVESAGGDALAEPTPRLLQRLEALQNLVHNWLPGAAALTVHEVIRLAGTDAEQASPPDWAAAVLPLAERALDALTAARAREGERLCAMLLDRVAQLRELARLGEPLVPKLVEQQRARFLERWREAMALGEGAVAGEAAQERALSEATAFAIRIDVAEELTRLAAHLDEIERLLHKGGEVGKRLEFLIQELHREANTLGAKSAALESTRISVDMKVLIEQMREQVQNIE